MKFTDITIRNLKPPEKGAKIHYDDTLPGFGVRVSEGGTKSFILTYGARRQRETIGRVGILGLKDARTEAKRLLADNSLGKHRPAKVGWFNASQEFLEHIQEHRKERTYKDYSRHLKYFPFGKTKLGDVAPKDISERLDKLSQGEREHAYAVVRAFLNWAHRKHYLENNPIERISVPKHSKPRERILTDDELAKVWKACEGTHGRIVKLLILTGQLAVKDQPSLM